MTKISPVVIKFPRAYFTPNKNTPKPKCLGVFCGVNQKLFYGFKTGI